MTEKKNNIYTIVAWDVDTQRDFMEDGKNSKAYVGKLALPEAMSIAANLKSLTEYLREKDIPLFASVDWHKEHAFEFAKDGESPNFLTTFPPHCLQETYGAENIDATRKRSPLYIDWETEESLQSIEEKIRAHKGETVFRKDRFDVFDKAGNPYAADLIKNLGIEKALVYGVATDVCVDFAVKGLLNAGIEVFALSNCMYGIDQKNSANKMKEWEEKGAKLLHLDEVLRNGI